MRGSGSPHGALAAIALMVLLLSSPAAAQVKWVEEFLARYNVPERVHFPPASLNAATSLEAIVQSGIASLTTQDVVRLLLENNRELIVGRGIPRSSFYSTESLKRPFQLNLHGGGTISHTTSPSSNVLAGAASLVQLAHDYNVGLDQVLPTGTAYTIDFDFNRLSSNSVFYVFNPAYNGTIRYRITQHLMRDFGRLVNTHEIRIARNNQKISELDFELQIIDQVTTALESYWDIVFAAEDVKVKRRSLDLALKTLHDNRAQVRIGTMAAIDLAQAEAEAATRSEDLVVSQYTLDKLQDEMKKQISRQLDPGIVLAHLNLVEQVTRPGGIVLPPLNEAVQLALQNRCEVKQTDHDIDNQDINVRFMKNQKRPVVDVSGEFSHAGLGGTQTIRSGIGQDSQVVRVVPGGIGDMFASLFAYRYPGYSAGFSVKIPLTNGAAEADYVRALNEHEMAANRKAATEQQVALEVRNAYTQIDMNKARVETTRTARELTERRLAAEQAKFEAGTSTVRFVLEEQRNLAQAETNEMQALVNYTKAIVAYDRAIGNTLARHGIALDTGQPVQPSSP